MSFTEIGARLVHWMETVWLYFAEIGARLVNLMETVWYPGLLFATFLENFIPPIPSEVIMPLGGYLASIGKMNIILVILIGTLGSTLGTLPYFYIGKFFSRHKISGFVEKYGKYFFYSRVQLDNLYEIFNKHDRYRVFFARFLPGARSLISLPAGSADMDIKKFLFLTYLGTMIRTTLWTLIGYFLGKQQKMVSDLVGSYEHYALYFLVLVVVMVIVWSVVSKRKE